jgi:hypothetical protein
MTAVDGIKRIASRVVANHGRMPRSGQDIYARGTAVGTQLADKSSSSSSPRTTEGNADQLSSLREELTGHLMWMGSRRTRRYIPRYHKRMARAGATSATVSQKLGCSDAERPVSFIVASTIAYVLVTVIAMIGLEGTMMYLSTAVFDATLGIGRYILAATAGVLLFLPGHWIGDLIHAAETSASRVKRIATPSAALALLIAAALAIFSMGTGRDSNLRSSQLTNAATTLIAQANTLEFRAETLSNPVRTVKRPKLSPSVRAQVASLRSQAAADNRQAAALVTKAENMKTLKFLAFVQLLAVISGAGGGYFFAAAADTRRVRRERWWARRALAIRGRVISIVCELLGYGKTSNAAAGIELALNGGHRWLVMLEPSENADASVNTVRKYIEAIADLLLGDPRAPVSATQELPGPPRSPELSPGKESDDPSRSEVLEETKPAQTSSDGPEMQQIVDEYRQQSNNHNNPEVSPGTTERS